VKFHNLVTGFMPADEFDAIAGAIQFFGEQFNQRFIRRGVHGRRGDFDFQFVTKRRAEFIF
jgi:hypothetical protein